MLRLLGLRDCWGGGRRLRLAQGGRLLAESQTQLPLYGPDNGGGIRRARAAASLVSLSGCVPPTCRVGPPCLLAVVWPCRRIGLLGLSRGEQEQGLRIWMRRATGTNQCVNGLD